MNEGIGRRTWSATRKGNVPGRAHADSDAISDINQIISEISTIQTSITTAIEQQKVITESIDQSVCATAEGNVIIDDAISKVSRSAIENRKYASSIENAAGRMNAMADSLEASVFRFLKNG